MTDAFDSHIDYLKLQPVEYELDRRERFARLLDGALHVDFNGGTGVVSGLRGSAAAERRAHNPKVGGSNPLPATISPDGAHEPSGAPGSTGAPSRPGGGELDTNRYPEPSSKSPCDATRNRDGARQAPDDPHAYDANLAWIDCFHGERT